MDDEDHSESESNQGPGISNPGPACYHRLPASFGFTQSRKDYKVKRFSAPRNREPSRRTATPNRSMNESIYNSPAASLLDILAR